jgi:hypothetical protein
VKALQGDMFSKDVDVSVLVDIIGGPLTPVSVARVGRQTSRRVFMR